jgi:hypothetical protein
MSQLQDKGGAIGKSVSRLYCQFVTIKKAEDRRA